MNHPTFGKNLEPQSKTGVFKKIALIFTAFMFLLVSSAILFYWFAGGSFDKPRRSGAALTAQNGDNIYDNYNYPNKVNILVLGVDERSTDVGRSDTMFVIMLDTKSKQVSLLSIPRDTRVPIPGFGWDKINHAYAHGGIDLSKRTVERFLGIPIDYHASIDFAGFYKIIDALGGITVNVEERMYYEDPYDDLVIDLKPGVQTLNGRTAIHYVRYRDEEGDIGRITRQQKFIKAVVQKTASPLILTSLPAIIRDATSAVKTNMTTSEIIGLTKFLNNAANNGLKTEMVHGAPALIDEIDYWIPDIMSLRNYIAATQGLSSDQKWLAASRAQSKQYDNAIPARAIFDEQPPWLTSGEYARFNSQTTPDDNDGDNDDDAPAKNTDTSKQLDKSKESDKLKQPDKSKQPDKLKQPAKTQPNAPPPPTAAKGNTGNTTNNAADAKKTAGKTTAPLRVNIINASGSPSAADKMAALMRQEGFEVAGVTSSSNPTTNTVVIANTTDKNVTGRLTSLPFRYALRINEDAAKANLITVIVGKDYLR